MKNLISEKVLNISLVFVKLKFFIGILDYLMEIKWTVESVFFFVFFSVK